MNLGLGHTVQRWPLNNSLCDRVHPPPVYQRVMYVIRTIPFAVIVQMCVVMENVCLLLIAKLLTNNRD